MTIKMLPAYDGDCLLLTLPQPAGPARHILIDGGPGRTYRQLAQEVQKLQRNKQVIDLLIITHIDDDHIGGILKLFEDPLFDPALIKQVWFNSGAMLAKQLDDLYVTSREVALYPQADTHISITQGNTLERYLQQVAGWNETLIHIGTAPLHWDTLKITVLSPDYQSLEKLHKHWPVASTVATLVSSSTIDYARSIEELNALPQCSEDKAICNGSSLAILLETTTANLLFLGDAHPSVVAASLKRLGYSAAKPLEAAFIKIAHHGSRYNTNAELLSLWRCQHYGISTNGLKHGFPHKECLAKLIGHSAPGVTLYFNYPVVTEHAIFSARDYEQYSFACVELATADHTIELPQYAP
jgi:beta-lactamase superfamily II metal-dependent hydrolase